jgi:serine O-acetyltransferase
MATKACRHGDLERALDRIVDSYDGPEEINNLESAALPNKRAVIDAFNHLKPLIYLGFYSTRPLNRDNLRYSLSEHLYPAYEILVEQIDRAVTYEACLGRSAPRDPNWSDAAGLRLFDALPMLRQKLNLDVVGAQEGDPAAQSIEEVVFSYPVIEAITAYRLAHVLYQEDVPMIPRIISEYAHSKTGIDIHPGAQIGDRFFIDHGTGVVIGQTCIIGNNVRLYQSVTLGALSLRGAESAALRSHKRHPTIEDDVTIYSNATILGGDTVIGRGSIIGGNVWLTHSIPPNSKITYDAQRQV